MLDIILSIIVMFIFLMWIIKDYLYDNLRQCEKNIHDWEYIHSSDPIANLKIEYRICKHCYKKEYRKQIRRFNDEYTDWKKG
jgi:hypothetical protein